MRNIGDVLLDLEPILDEMVDMGLEMGDILALVKTYLEVHNAGCVEEYVDGTNPHYFYGHRDYIKIKKVKK